MRHLPGRPDRNGPDYRNLARGESTIILKNVPAEVCTNCGEYYLSESVTNQLLTRAEAAVQSGAELEILRFAA